jgi:hypothetical protein
VRLFGRIADAAKAIAATLRPAKPAAMIGPPPSARKLPAIPADPAEHAVQFGTEYADRLEHYIEGRMHALDIPEHQFGYSDQAHGSPWRVFFPHGGSGGGVVGDRIGVDSGVLNPELLAKPYGPEASTVWARSRLRDRIDAIIAHEYAEAVGVSHEEAVSLALDTPLAIRERARRILRAMAEAERKR